ncbi:MAG: hypothetical protein KTR32_21010 [Granulosicoccus sp.]|nr:hypothetical protein [Granulosicoccus sp.]
MTDLQKRATLKKMGVTGVGMAVAGTPAAAAWRHVAEKHEVVTEHHVANSGVSDLKIEIIASTSVPENTVLFTNMTDEEIVVQHFMPGSIIFGDQYLDLNGVRGDLLIRIPPKGVISRPVRLSRLSNQPVMEYVWADDAVTPITEQTRVVSLGAFVADQRWYVYPVPTVTSSPVTVAA